MQRSDGPHDASHNSTIIQQQLGVMNMSGLRYVDDPLVAVSGQFPLSRCDFSLPDRSEAPSGVATGEPRPPICKLDWTTIATKDGDEGPSKDYAWETVPDDD